MSSATQRGPSIAPRSVLAPSPAGSGAASSPELAGSPGAVTSIVTSKEWVLPPRPKPGRKPSADTPASKRKAQNRAAQRAFRERRATRVQELEQKLLEVEKEKELKEIGLVNTINKLKFENQFLIKSMNQLRLEFSSLKSTVAPASQSAANSPYTSQMNALAAPSPAEPNANYFKPEALRNSDSEINQTAQNLLSFAKALPAAPAGETPNLQLLVFSVQQILPAPSVESPRVSFSSSRTSSSALAAKNVPQKASSRDAEEFDCGICIKDLCLCEDAGLKAAQPSVEEKFESIKPMAAVSLKRKQPARETDFTSMFTAKKMPDLKRLRKDNQKLPQDLLVKKETNDRVGFNEDSPVENCGFCSDDTPCVCREAAKEAARLSQSLSDRLFDIDEADANEDDDNHSTALPPLQFNSKTLQRKTSLPVLHPGPTLEIREFSNATASSLAPVEQKEEKLGCTGNPGTCSQCQTDPMSTLFCTTVASKAAMQKKTDKGSEKETAETKADEAPDALPAPPQNLPSTSDTIFIPCADAYKTLSRHKRFSSVDFSSLVGRLTTRGMQVEVQSVANIIRELDKKVYD